MNSVPRLALGFICLWLMGCASVGKIGPLSEAGNAASNINVSTSTNVTITWATDQPASSQVEYGPTTAYASLSSLDPTLTTSHSVTLTGLATKTVYHCRVLSTNAAGIPVTSGDLTFTTQ